MNGDQQMEKLLQKSYQLSMMVVAYVQSAVYLVQLQSQVLEVPDELQKLLDAYECLFDIPKELSPRREHDHKILLQEGVAPVNVRPLRYPACQKDEIEKMIQYMLSIGVIRSNVSLY